MKGIDRAVSVVLCIVLAVVGLVSCGKKSEKDNPLNLATELKSYFAEDLQWTELKKENVSTHFGFDGNVLDEFSAFIVDSEGSSDIVAVFNFPDKQTQLTATEAIGKSIISAPSVQDNKTVKGVIVLSKETQTVVVVSKNTEKIAKMLNEKGYTV